MFPEEIVFVTDVLDGVVDLGGGFELEVDWFVSLWVDLFGVGVFLHLFVEDVGSL